jgi:enoyl-CoA hydratase/carnithine racemase
LNQALLTFPLPPIAAVNRPVLADGCDTVTLCDLCVVSTGVSSGPPEATWAPVVYEHAR